MARRNLREARILVTGASSGIGHALAMALAAEGAQLLLTARRADRLEQLVATIHAAGGTAAFIAGDITSTELRRELVAWMHEHWQGLDVLINNAGIGGIGDFASADAGRVRAIMEVNFFAAVELTRDCLPLLRAARGATILNVGSVLGHAAVPRKSEYCASKFALHGWTDALRMELRPLQIDVQLLSPSTTDSEFFDQALRSAGDAVVNRWKMSPAAVAHRAVRLLQRREREAILTWGGIALVWFDRLLPNLLSRILTIR